MTDDFLIDHRYKSYPPAAEPCRAVDIGRKGWNLLAGDLPFPLAVLRRSALEHNLAWMQDYASRRGAVLAPHGKTTMSPQLFARQLRAGAWGLTFATVFQASVGVEAGARRIIIANQVLCDADLDGMAVLLNRHADLRIWFLVDSVAQLSLIEQWSERHLAAPELDVLLEIGMPGQRTGCRTLDEALAVAQAIARSQAVRLGGIECYEGGLARCDSEHDTREVTALVRRVIEAAKAFDAQALFAGEEVLLTAGGSAVFDLVMPLLRSQGLSKPVRGVLRSGCYVTHDHGQYARFLGQVERREGLQSSLLPAMEVWSRVQSVPEPGLALLTCGRRDISFDIEMPIPIRHVPGGSRAVADSPAGWKISALNDQHAYLRFDPASTTPRVGDMVALWISHPCTTFDKWRWMAVVEEDWTVSGAIRTCF